MEITSKAFNGFLVLCFFGVFYSILAFGTYLDPELGKNLPTEFCWETSDTTLSFSFEQQGKLHGFQQQMDTDLYPASINTSYGQSEGWFFLNLRPHLLSWMLLFLIFNSFSFAMVGYLIMALRHWNRDQQIGFQSILYTLLTSLIAIIVLFLLASGKLVDHHNLLPPAIIWHLFPQAFQSPHSLLFIIQIPGYVLGLVCVASIILLGNAKQPNWHNNAADLRSQLSKVNRISYHLLLILSIALVFAVVNTSFLHKAVTENISGPIQMLFPESMLILYGGVFTFFIVIFYIPVYFKVKHWNQAALEFATKNDMDIDTVKQGSDSLLKLSNPKLLITIASPVISSLFPSLLELIKNV